MKASFSGTRLLRSVTSLSLLGIAGWAVVALSPGLAATFGTDGAEVLAFSRPVAPAVALPAQPAVDGEALVLANWEYTSVVTNDAALALTQTQLAVGAAGTPSIAATEVLTAYYMVFNAATAAGNDPALLLDAQRLLFIYNKIEANQGNPAVVLAATQQAVTVATKAVANSSPFQ